MSCVVIDSVPFTTYLRAAGHDAKGLLQRDRARAQKFLAGKCHHVCSSTIERRHGHHHKGTTTAPSSTVPSGTKGNITFGNTIDATDTGVFYTMKVGVGHPATEYTLVIDTGSGHTWVGAHKQYKPIEGISHDTGHAIKLEYTVGGMTGEEYTDTVTLGPKLVVKDQGIGVAKSVTGFKYFENIDGILGLGPVDLTHGDVEDTYEVPTVTDNLYSQHQIPRIIGVFYKPSSGANVSNGEITFGGIDKTKCTSDLNFVPLTTTYPASQYWGINQSVSYGTDSNGKLLDAAPGIVDTGSSYLLFATEAFEAYKEKTGGLYDEATKLLTVTEEQYENLKSLYFKIGDVTYEFTRNAQIWPRGLNTLLEGGQKDKIYLIVHDIGAKIGGGLDFVNGFSWLQRFYTVYDTESKQFGIATTAFTSAETN